MQSHNPRFSELLRQGLIIFFLRRKIVIGVFACTVLFTAVASLALVEQYRATASFVIKGFELDLARQLPGTDGFVGQGLHHQMLVTNEVRILGSPHVADGAVAKLGESWERHQFASSRVNLPGPVQALRELPGKVAAAVGDLFADDEAASGAAASEPLRGAVDPLAKRLSKLVDIKPSRDTAIVQLAVEHSNPAFALDAVDAYLGSYIDERRRIGQTEQAPEFYREEADRHWEELAELNAEMQVLKAELGVVDPVTERTTLVAHLNQKNAELEELRTARQEVARSRQALQSLQAGRAHTFQLPQGVSDPVLSQLLQRIGELEAIKADRLRTFAPQSSVVQGVEEELRIVRAQILKQADGLLTDLGRRQDSRIRILEENATDLRGRILELERAKTQITRLEEQAMLAQEQTRVYERKYSETATDRALRNRTLPNISIVSQAAVNPSPVFPDRKLLVGAAALLGLFLGMLIAFVQELLDDSIKLPDQIVHEFDIPVLGTFELEGVEGREPATRAVGALGAGG